MRQQFQNAIDIREPTRLIGIPDDPKPPLDIDARPIRGDLLAAWRKRQVQNGGGLYGYPSQCQIASAFGVSKSRWGRWERGRMPRFWSALFREWVRQGRGLELEVRAATSGHAEALSGLLGSRERLADSLGVHTTAVSNWIHDRPPSEKSGAGPLVLWLCDEFDLDPATPKSTVEKVTPADVVDMRRRSNCGEAYASIARDYPITATSVADACKGNTWPEVEMPEVDR